MFNSLITLHLSLFQIVLGSLMIIVAVVYFHNVIREMVNPRYSFEEVAEMRRVFNQFLEYESANQANKKLADKGNSYNKEIYVETMLQTHIQADIAPKNFISFYRFKVTQAKRNIR